MAINAGSVVVSLSAVLVSSWLARSQFRAQRHGNHIDPLIELLKEFRSLEFHRNYAFIRTELPHLSSDNGISGLSEDAQRKIYDIGYFLQLYAILADLDIVDERFIGTLLHRRYTEVWAALEPFVRRERELQGLTDGAILNILEDFAGRLRTRPAPTTPSLPAQRRPR